jgi:drug/metabolite transporter (DMT)-like permease
MLPRSPLTNEITVALALLSASLTSLGIFFQKINGERGGNAFISGWLALSIISFYPTFLIANRVFLLGGRMSLFVPATASAYVASMLLGRFYFGETVSWGKWFGCSLILVGVWAIARE